MPLKMDAERVAKWKCLLCGSKLKRTVTAFKNNTKMGFSMVCCSCGHTDNFVTNLDAIPIYTVGAGAGDRLTEIKIACGCSESDANICDQTTCPCKRKDEAKNNEVEPPIQAIKKGSAEVGKNRLVSLSPPTDTIVSATRKEYN